MKRLLPILLFITTTTLIAQPEDQNIAPTCYQKYAKVFEERGAKSVNDGTYDDVIITFRHGSSADCFYGKVKVKDGVIVKEEIFLKFEDDSYERVLRQYKHADDDITINNGISKTMVTIDDELINIMFVKMIKPKKKKYVRAPDPEFDFD